MSKKIWSAALLAAVMLLAAGCGQKPGASPGGTPAQNPPEQNTPGNSSGGNGTQGGTQGAPSEQKTETVEVYYTDQELLNLEKASAEIKYDSEKEKYSAAFKALKSGKGELLPLWEKVELKSAELANGKLTLDLHIPDEARFGAGGEALAVDALKKTMFQFKEVETMQLLVDGKQVESLMGHVGLDNPETR